MRDREQVNCTLPIDNKYQVVQNFNLINSPIPSSIIPHLSRPVPNGIYSELPPDSSNFLPKFIN